MLTTERPTYSIGPRLLAAMQAASLTKSQLAERTGMPWTQIHKLVRGERRNVEAETIRRLAKALGCTTDFLLGMDEEITHEV